MKDHFYGKEGFNIVEADVSNYQQLLKVTGSKIDIAFYLMHSMEGSTKGWKKFSQKDRTAAENFAKAATENGVKRIIYLSGLVMEK
jgi:nucleoside-diphosphate-sugar epimerase